MRIDEVHQALPVSYFDQFVTEIQQYFLFPVSGQMGRDGAYNNSRHSLQRTGCFDSRAFMTAGQYDLGIQPPRDFDRKSNADFFLLREARRARYQGSRAVPILDVIDAVELPDVVKHTIKQILTSARQRG